MTKTNLIAQSVFRPFLSMLVVGGIAGGVSKIANARLDAQHAGGVGSAILRVFLLIAALVYGLFVGVAWSAEGIMCWQEGRATTNIKRFLLRLAAALLSSTFLIRAIIFSPPKWVHEMGILAVIVPIPAILLFVLAIHTKLRAVEPR